MNIIAITIDGARPDIVREFPGFDDFFREGAYFPATITYAPYTVASLHAIFTGIYGNENGVDNYYGCGDFRGDSCKTLTQYMKDAGYHTRGDTFNRMFAPEQGFDELTIYDEYEENLTERHRKILREIKDKDKFFLWLHYSKIHTSLVKEVIKKYDDFSEEYFEDREGNLQRYKSFVEKASEYFAGIVEECRGLEDTLIVVFSDHGVSVGERVGEKVYGSYCYDYTLKAFSFFYLPGTFPSKEIPMQVRTVDIMPTILELAGIDILGVEDRSLAGVDGKSVTTSEGMSGPKIEGRSVMPLVKGKEDEERIAYSETGGLGGPTPSPKMPNVKSVRTDGWKLIYNETRKEREFYNLNEDPSEENNLAGKGLEEEDRLWGILKGYLWTEKEKLDSAIDSLDI